jgi:hypothetical protein
MNLEFKNILLAMSFIIFGLQMAFERSSYFPKNINAIYRNKKFIKKTI